MVRLQPRVQLSLRHGRNQDVARPAHRLDDLRVIGVGFELLAQAADLHVDRAVEGPGRAAARVLDQEVARQHPAGMTGEHAQQLVLAGGHGHRFAAVTVEQASRGRVELPLGEAQPRVPFGREPVASARASCGGARP